MKALSRILLVVLYFFLLAPQCHSRFYSIANFYLASAKYSSHITAAKKIAEETVQAKAKHLRLDKRFRNAPSYSEHPQTVFNNYLAVVYFVSRQQKLFDHPVIIYSNAFVHARSLRGPPCA